MPALMWVHTEWHTYVYPYLSKNTWDLTKDELFFGLVIALLVSFGYFYLINFQF